MQSTWDFEFTVTAVGDTGQLVGDVGFGRPGLEGDHPHVQAAVWDREAGLVRCGRDGTRAVDGAPCVIALLCRTENRFQPVREALSGLENVPAVVRLSQWFSVDGGPCHDRPMGEVHVPVAPASGKFVDDLLVRGPDSYRSRDLLAVELHCAGQPLRVLHEVIHSPARGVGSSYTMISVPKIAGLSKEAAPVSPSASTRVSSLR